MKYILVICALLLMSCGNESNQKKESASEQPVEVKAEKEIGRRKTSKKIHSKKYQN